MTHLCSTAHVNACFKNIFSHTGVILFTIYGPSSCIKGPICDKDVLSSDTINAVEILMTTDVYDILGFRCIHLRDSKIRRTAIKITTFTKLNRGTDIILHVRISMHSFSK
jgi:hypothetical protein